MSVGRRSEVQWIVPAGESQIWRKMSQTVESLNARTRHSRTVGTEGGGCSQRDVLEDNCELDPGEGWLSWILAA